jgi:hypothetical protein
MRGEKQGTLLAQIREQHQGTKRKVLPKTLPDENAVNAIVERSKAHARMRFGPFRKNQTIRSRVPREP